MVRPREFDRDEALQKAMALFWVQGFAATSTDDLVTAMGIGRQSLYNTFGDKRQLYLEALHTYQQKLIDGHLERLASSQSALEGVRNLLVGLIPEDACLRARGCMGIGSVSEFGAGDADVTALRDKAAQRLSRALLTRIKQGQDAGDIDPTIDAKEVAAFVMLTMSGLQLAARSGAGAKELHRQARFAADRLKPR